jgi:thiol-disulfide isomerase/thioredoxin
MEFLKKEFESSLDNALENSKQDGKNILIEFGGDWCIWSKRMANALQTESIKLIVSDSFHFLKCYMGEDGENYFPFSEINVPEFSSVPFFILLNEHAQLIDFASTEQFEMLWFYKKGKILNFLSGWAHKSA